MFDFPSSPTRGQIYSPTGGPAFAFDGVSWLLASPTPAPVGAALPRMRCTVGGGATIAFQNGTSYGVHGGTADLWGVNVGGWTLGAALGGFNQVVVPQSGVYWLRNRVYVQPGRGPGGRVSLNSTVSGLGIFLQGSAQLTVNDYTLEATTVSSLSQGEMLFYSVSTANLGAFGALGHTEIEAVMLAPNPVVYSVAQPKGMISSDFQYLSADSISFDIPVPAGARVCKMILSSIPTTTEGYPTLIFMNNGTWVNAAGSYVLADISKQGTGALGANAGGSNTNILLGNQSNQGVPTLVEITIGLNGQPSVVAKQHAYGAAGDTIGLRTGVATSGYVPQRIGLQVNNGTYLFKAGSWLQYEFWG